MLVKINSNTEMSAELREHNLGFISENLDVIDLMFDCLSASEEHCEQSMCSDADQLDIDSLCQVLVKYTEQLNTRRDVGDGDLRTLINKVNRLINRLAEVSLFHPEE